MHGLHDVQAAFARALLGQPSGIALRVRGKGLSTEQRLAIYRNNTRLSLTQALRNTFPVVGRLIGKACFDELALALIRREPPRTACLHEYGAGFADFLATYAPVAGLPYLPDVARLEWHCHEAYFGAEAQGLRVDELARVPLACHERLRFVLHPTARLMASDYPVGRIWETNQVGFSGEDRVDLGDGGCRLLILRPGLTVEMHHLERGDHALLTALAKGDTIGQALDAALEEAQGFDLLASLQRCLGLGVLADFSY